METQGIFHLMLFYNGIDFYHNDCGILHIYKNQKSWDKARRTLDRFKDTKWGRVEAKGNLAKKYNIYSKDIVGATFTKGDSVGDIHAFCRHLSYYASFSSSFSRSRSCLWYS